MQKGDARQNEYHGKVAKRMNHVARQEDTDDERHDRRDIGNACSSDRAKVLNNVVVNDVSQTRPAQPQTKDQAYPGAGSLDTAPIPSRLVDRKRKIMASPI